MTRDIRLHEYDALLAVRKAGAQGAYDERYTKCVLALSTDVAIDIAIELANKDGYEVHHCLSCIRKLDVDERYDE